MPHLNWLSDPDKNVLPQPLVRTGCGVYLYGWNYTTVPAAFTPIRLTAPSVAWVKRLLGKPTESRLNPVRVRLVAEGEYETQRPIDLSARVGGRHFAFEDDQGSRSDQLTVSRHVKPAVVDIAGPDLSVDVMEVFPGVALAKVGADFSASRVKVQVTGAVDPVVKVTLASATGLLEGWAALVAAESDLTDAGTTRWLLGALLEESAGREQALAFLRAAEAAGLAAPGAEDDAGRAEAVAAVLAEHPFTLHSGEEHRDDALEVAAGVDYVTLLGDWGIDGLLALTDHYRVLRDGLQFVAPTMDGEPDATVEVGEGEQVELEFLVPVAEGVETRFVAQAVSTVDGEQVTEYSDLMTVTLRDGDLTFWEDPEQVRVIGGGMIA